MSKLIQLTQGKVAIVDDEDFENLNKNKWYYSKGYAGRKNKIKGPDYGKLIYMHREVMDAPEGKQVDHKNHKKLDNRKENLRICSNAENNWNKSFTKRNKIGEKGVWYIKNDNKYGAMIKKNGVTYWIGSFQTKEEAAAKYREKAKELHGEFVYDENIKEADLSSLTIEPRAETYVNKTSPYIGVSLTREGNRFVVLLKGNYLGMFLSANEAARKYNEAAIKLDGEKAILNKIEDSKDIVFKSKHDKRVILSNGKGSRVSLVSKTNKYKVTIRGKGTFSFNEEQEAISEYNRLTQEDNN